MRFLYSKQKKENYDVGPQDVIKILDKLKSLNGEQVVIVETPDGTVSLCLKDALIYEGHQGEIVIDSE